MRRPLVLLLGLLLVLTGCGDIYTPKTIERLEYEPDSTDQAIEDFKTQVKTEYEQNKNDTRYPVVIGYESGEAKWGFINDQGGLVISPIYDSASYFYEGVAAVSRDGEYFYIDVNGDKVFEGEFTSVSDFYNGYAVYTRTVEGETVMGFLSSAGSMTDYPDYTTNTSMYSEGIAVVKKDDQYTFMRQDGTFVTDNLYDDAMPFSEGMALVVIDDSYGYININGEVAVAIEYSYSPESTYYYQGFHNGLAAVKFSDGYGYIDKQGQIAIEPQFDYGSVFSDYRASVDVGPIDYYIDTTGERALDTDYEYASSFKNGYAFVKSVDEENSDDDLSEYLNFKIINTAGTVIVDLNIQYDHGGGYTFPMEWTEILENDVARIVYHDEDGIHFAYVNLESGELIWE